MLAIFEAITRYKYLVETNISRAEKAADKLRKQLRMDYAPPVWLLGVSVVLDSGRSRAVIEVIIKSGYQGSNLPTHIDGIPVITRSEKSQKLPF